MPAVPKAKRADKDRYDPHRTHYIGGLTKDWLFCEGDIEEKRLRDKGPVYTAAKTETKLFGGAAMTHIDTPDSYFPHSISEEHWERVTLPHDYSPDRKMWAGKIAVAVAVGESAGTLRLFATATGLKAAVLNIPVK